jgi:ribosomal-protein-alanine N-acetyltransferase
VTNSTTLSTERLLLRPWSFDDVDAAVAYANNEEWSRYLPLPFPYTRRKGEEYIARNVLTNWNTHPAFALVLDGVPIGGIDFHVDTGSATASIGYAVARAQWGHGLVAEAAVAAIDWAFRELELAKLTATADLLNQQSWRVMEKLGMTREGLFRSARILRGRRQDVVHYGVLREEWLARRR